MSSNYSLSPVTVTKQGSKFSWMHQQLSFSSKNQLTQTKPWLFGPRHRDAEIEMLPSNSTEVNNYFRTLIWTFRKLILPHGATTHSKPAVKYLKELTEMPAKDLHITLTLRYWHVLWPALPSECQRCEIIVNTLCDKWTPSMQWSLLKVNQSVEKLGEKLKCLTLCCYSECISTAHISINSS